MKKTIAILLGVSCAMAVSSCFTQEDDLWDESSAQRLNEAADNYKSALCASEDGWVLQYFANEVEAGYPLLMKFDEHGGVKMAADNAVSSGGQYAEVESTYELITDQSVVLTFNTYNSLLHTFSDPGGNGVGHGGDYEFVFTRMSEKQDTIFLKGKKYGLQMRLVKFPKGKKTANPYSGVERVTETWSSYYDVLDDNMATLFNSSFPTLILQAGEERYTVTGMENGTCAFVPEGGNPLLETIGVSYIMYLDGSISFSTPFEGLNGNFSVQNFKPSEKAATLVCTDEGQNATISSLGIGALYGEIGWRLADATAAGANMPDYGLGGKFLEIYKRLLAENKQALRSDFEWMQLEPNSKGGYALKLSFGNKGEANYYLDMAFDGKTLKLTDKGDADKNGKNLKKLVPTSVEFLNLLTSAEFEVSLESPVLCPRMLKAVSKSNPADWFYLNLP